MFLCSMLTLMLTLLCSAAFAAVYYLDSAAGDDARDGQSEQTPWCTLEKVNMTTFAPGDEIRLKRGGRWRGQLWPKGSGEKGKPILVGAYGEGSRPAIHAEGEHFEALRLYNQQYWEISGLEITNHGPAGPAPRTGVRVLGEDAGLLSHICLRDLDVHDDYVPTIV